MVGLSVNFQNHASTFSSDKQNTDIENMWMLIMSNISDHALHMTLVFFLIVCVDLLYFGLDFHSLLRSAANFCTWVFP